jgi:hypothetical protein
MLQLILVLVVIGAVLGLIFYRRGEEADGALRGAKTGAKIGCGCGCLVLVLLFLAFMAAASLGYLEGVEFPGVHTPAPSDSGTTTTTLLR